MYRCATLSCFIALAAWGCSGSDTGATGSGGATSASADSSQATATGVTASSATSSSTNVTSSSTGSGGGGGGGPEAGKAYWSVEFGDVDPQTTHGYHRLGGLGVDAAGNVLIAGQFTGTLKLSDTITLSQGPSGKAAVFVAKLDPTGHAIWGNAYPGGDGFVLGAAVGPSGNIVVGGSYKATMTVGTTTLAAAALNARAFLIDVDTNGAVLLARAYGSGDASINGVAVGADGAIALTGSFSSTIDFGGNQLANGGGTQTDVFVAKLDALGNHLLSNRFGDAGGQSGTGVVITSDGGVVFTGYATGTTNFGGLPLTATHTATFIAKLNSSGSHVFSHLYDNSALSDTGRRQIVRDANNQLFLTTEAVTGALNHVTFGQSVVDGYSYRAAFSPTGDFEWALGLPGYSGAAYGAIDPLGNLIVAGDIHGATDFGFGTVTPLGIDAYAARYEPALGAVYAAVPIVDANQQNGSQETGGIASDAEGNWAVGGTFSGVIDLGAGQLTAAQGGSGSDIFVALLKP